ncbi:tropomyosin isoform X2 [Drosophila subpulchrella]|uniref:tropomyosin isoform X2 n=1 Tax=Drosophila subpulchrella TaxID=1486046 RepID=UPI0018A1406C|nr:tropomyosin isoform X2 [Drosophila subpulchrella]
MEETEILENQNVTQADKMKPASAHGEHKELYLLNVSDSEDSLKQMNLDKKKLNGFKNSNKQSNMDNLEQNQAKEKSPDITHKDIELQDTQKIESKESRKLSKAEETVKTSGAKEGNIKMNKETEKTNPKDSKELSQEAKTEVSGTMEESVVVSKASSKIIPKKPKVQSQEKLRDAASSRKLKVEEKSQKAFPSSQLLAEESQKNPKGETKEVEQNPNKGNQESGEIPKIILEKPEKRTLNETNELVTSKEQDTIPKSEPIFQALGNEKPDQSMASTSLASREKMEKPKETRTATNSIRTAVKPTKKDVKSQPREKIKKDMEEYFSGIQALEVRKKLTDDMNAKEAEAILKEEQRRKSWKEMLLEVGKATSLSTSTTSSGRPPRSVVIAILQRTAKAEYKRKMTILKDNFNYRLGLIKQLKHDMKNNFKSEAQQLYCDYHSIKNQTQNQPTLSDMHTVYSMPNNSHDV